MKLSRKSLHASHLIADSSCEKVGKLRLKNFIYGTNGKSLIWASKNCASDKRGDGVLGASICITEAIKGIRAVWMWLVLISRGVLLEVDGWRTI